MARVTIGIEIRRYATLSVDVDDPSADLDQIAEKAIHEDSPELDWNAIEIDCVEVLNVADNTSDDSDRAFEERRDMVNFG